MPSTSGRPRRCSSTAWNRSAPPTTPFSTSWRRLLFLRSYSRANTPLLRQQLKWLYRGAWLAVVPFTLFYAIPFLFDLHTAQPVHQSGGFSIVFLPLTFSWAIIRYRLMDTDLIFKRGVAYTLATGLILGGYFGVIAAGCRRWPTIGCPSRSASGARASPSCWWPPSSSRSSAGFRAGWTGSSTAIATTIARR